MQPAKISYLTDITFGFGALAGVAQTAADLGMRRPMIVTDPPLVTLGVVDRLAVTAAAVFDQVESNPTEQSAVDAAQRFGEAQCDGLIAIGGGSPIDLAKAIALLADHPGPLAQYALIHGGADRITSNMPPVIAIPTTAGTGSEVGRAALITLATGDKLALISPHMIPDAAICDPELTMSMPAHLTAATGMDAVSHCVENYCSPRFNPAADAIALDGLERAYRHIRTAVFEPTDREARTQMMTAALEGGLTFQKGLGAVHALSHPLGALRDKRLHHGTLNAVFLPHVLRFNADACPDKMGIMARRMGLKSAADLPDAAAQLTEQLNLPLTLGALGLAGSDLEPLAAKAIADHCSAANPRAMTEQHCANLYRQAL